MTTFAYDNAYRLIDEWRTGANAYRTSHSYDPVGNRTVEETDGSKTTFTYDAANQLKTSEPEDVHDPSITYTYDQAGNLQKEFIYATGSATTYSWDDENRMTGIVFPASGKATMLYNADGLRVKKEDSGGTVKSIWDFQNVLAETDGSNSTQAVYTLAPRLYGNLLSQRRGSTSHFHLFDALGSTIGLTNASETLSDSYLYKAYGETLASSGSTVNPFKWVGQVGYYDDASPVGLHYVRARYYNDLLARWMSEDPIGYQIGDVNLFEYVGSRSPNMRDPSGLFVGAVVDRYCDFNKGPLGGCLSAFCGIVDVLDCALSCFGPAGQNAALASKILSGIDCGCDINSTVVALLCCRKEPLQNLFFAVGADALSCVLDMIQIFGGGGRRGKPTDRDKVTDYFLGCLGDCFSMFGDLAGGTSIDIGPIQGFDQCFGTNIAPIIHN